MLAAAASLTLGACAARDNGGSSGNTNSSAAAPSQAANAANPAGDGKAVCSGVSLAYAGTINGASAALGQNILRGADLAVKQHNKANPNCQVTLKQFDTEGKPDKAPGIVTQVINEADIIGVVGLPFSGESKAAGNLFNQAGLVTISPSATNPALADNGWKTFFRGMGNDAAQGPAAAKLLTDTLKANKVCVIEDDSEYGIGLATQLKQALGSKATCSDKVKTGQTDFSAVVNKIATESPDAIFYSGYYPEAGPFAQQLNDKGVTAKFVGPDGVKDPEFLKAAGAAANNAYFTCPCVPEDNFKDFTAAFKATEGADPGTYSPEGYDVTTILLKGIDSGIKDRAGLLNFVKNYDGQGLTKHFKWNDKGELSDTPVWSYRVQNGKIVNNGQIS
ncbi:branched-chain amino acid ABC transporter substrate-binding protein [Amycolatopsis alkalitolerans]|uniref:Branched-chain amino acid ABC transporter substrate-binding protein n=1 Tax=Amycolatopsis alkalitolerans TaxID=2547244 RepID=A0A5C4LZT0_9PSEU|nr:branched-chain amino acid ABC transporter substrate-binding protein [Amycolatopsis alkalitolerans]TNC25484.1 branched-chain amino acid ABC transporter substrate-binding protein [Amycolatopsis alkalitolerans]